MNWFFHTLVFILLSLLGIAPLAADWRDQVGYTRLQLLAAGELPPAPGQGFAQIEATEISGNYTPDIANALFSGKTFTLKSGASGLSGHAQGVAGIFFGNPTSLVTGNCPVDLYEAGNWLNAGFLKLDTSNAPATEVRAVQNHSWILELAQISNLDATEANRRLDFAIDRDGFVSVVGVNNGTPSTTLLPQLLGQSYHTISVGLTNGNHSAGFTHLDVSGRIKPDIVAPLDFTSFSTPMVSSAAGLLFAKLSSAPYSLAGADRPRVIKALLLASARRDTVASWNNTSTRPLDLRYGAGELNIHHAYHALRTGKSAASPSQLRPSRGWGAESANGNSSETYFFNIPPGASSTPFGAALTWHRSITQSRLNNWNATLANLNLRLHQASGFTLGPLVAESLSTVDNVELVARTTLAPGNYALVVDNLSTTITPYALAWHSLPGVTLATTAATAREIDLQPGIVTISRTGDTNLPLLVPLNIGGTATAGVHYVALPTSVSIPAGQTSVSVPITPLADTLAQGDRSITVSIAEDFALVRDPTQSALVTLIDKPFDAWRFTNFTALQLADPAVSGETADPDGDGLANLIEYALALDPNLPGISPVIASQSGGYLNLASAKNAAATDITWSAQVSDDLANWQPAVILTDSLAQFEARDSILVAAAGKRFIRLKITRP